MRLRGIFSRVLRVLIDGGMEAFERLARDAEGGGGSLTIEVPITRTPSFRAVGCVLFFIEGLCS